MFCFVVIFFIFLLLQRPLMALLLAMLVADDDDDDDGNGVSLPALRYPAMLYIEITSWKARAYGIFRHELVKYLKSNE